MAVQNKLFGSGAGNNEIDLIDIIALMILPIFASLQFKVWSWQVEVFGGYDFSKALWTIGGTGISVTTIVIVFAVGWILATNLANLQTEMEDWEMGIAGAALLLPVGYVLMPSVEALVMYHDMTQVAAALYVSTAATYISYVG